MRQLTCIFIFILSAGALRAQEHLAEQYGRAMELYKAGEYYDAVTEFKRLLFFDSRSRYNSEAEEYIGLSYKAGGFYGEAVKHFNRAVYSAETAADKGRLKLEIIKCNLLRGTFSRGEQLLNELENDTLNNINPDTINYWRGWSYMLQSDWSKAAEKFGSIKPDHELKLLSERTSAEQYPVTLLKISSVILPGSGQFITGNYFSGLLSLGWNVLFGYLTINAFIEDRIFDGLITGNLLWLRFYRGNIENAEKFALEENAKTSNRAFLYLMNEYKGDKP